MISHHPSDPTLASYASGILPAALALVTATHAAGCPLCQRTLATLEATGGALLEELSPVAMSDGAFDRLFDRTDAPLPAPLPILNPGLPAPLNRVPFGRWWPIGLGLRYRPLRIEGAAWGGLVLAQPGRSLPRHGHTGLELTAILSGRFVDDSGEFAAGDLCEPEADHDRPQLAVGTEPCLCIIASEGMQLRGILGFGQRLIGL